MAKVTLNDVSTFINDTSAVATVNNNNTTIEAAFENTLSRDGTSPNTMGADLDMNSNQILNLPAPTAANDPITKTYFDTNVGNAADTLSYATEWANKAEDSLISAAAGGDQVDDYSALHHANKASTSASNASTSETNAASSAATAQAAAAGMNWRTRVLNATTANITLSGEQTIDGILTSTSRILVKDQTAPAENGIYITAAGAWARADDMNSWDEVPSTVVAVEQGTVNEDTIWLCVSDTGGTLETTAIDWNQYGAGTVTSITAGTGLDGGTITQTGTISISNGGVGTTQLADDGVTADKVDISSGVDTVITASDELLFGDVSDSNNVKKDTVQGILDLVSATGISIGTPQASTSGTSIDFTSIPAGTKQITISLVGVSTTGTSELLIQLGDSGGIEAIGYLAASSSMITGIAVTQYSTGFGIRNQDAAGIWHGSLTLTLVDSSTFTWVGKGNFCRTDTTQLNDCAGSKSLSAELDRIRITTVGGSDTFDAGKINIAYS